jgi:hypothetical protein
MAAAVIDPQHIERLRVSRSKALQKELEQIGMQPYQAIKDGA